MNIFKLFLFIIPLVFASCETSQTPVNELSSLLEKIDNNSENYSDEELKEIGRIKGQILAKMTKSAVKDLKKQMEDLSKQLEGGLEGFFEEFNNEEVE